MPALLAYFGADAPRESQVLTRFRRRAQPETHQRKAAARSTLVDVALVSLGVAATAVFVKICWPMFGYWGDNAESFLPLWHALGQRMRDGESVLFDPQGWGGASVVGESAYGVFNPVTLANAWAVSHFDNLARSAFLVMTEFLIVLGLGVYALARINGARRWAAIAVGVAMPFAGFTLFYEAGNWASGLMSITWVTHFWWSAQAYSRGRINPLVPFAFGCLAATVGNPYSMLGILVVLAGIGLELLVRREWHRLAGAVTMGGCIGLVLVLVYLPLMSILSQTDRSTSSAFDNHNYLSPTLSDVLAMSAPSYLTRTEAWYSASDLVPSSYLAWFIIPLLPWLRWRTLHVSAWSMSLLLATGFYLLLTFGPDQAWLFRWPIRFIEYGYVGLAALFAVAVSHGLARDHVRRRAGISAILLAVGWYSAWSSQPPAIGLHTVTVVMSAILLAALVVVMLRQPRYHLAFGLVVLVVGTAAFAGVQAREYNWHSQHVANDADLRPPTSLAAVQKASAEMEAPILQVADIFGLTGSEAVASGDLVFGNLRYAAGYETVNRYSGIAYRELTTGIAIDYRGSVYESITLEELFGSLPGEFDVSYVNAMGLNTVVVDRQRSDLRDVSPAPEGWTRVDTTEHSWIFVRDDLLVGPTVTTTDGIRVNATTSDGPSLDLEIDADEDGSLLLDRLSWLGYTATADGEPIDVGTGPLGLLRLDVPAGTTRVTLDYAVPGLVPGAVAAGVGTLVALVHGIAWFRRRRIEALVPAPPAL